MKKRFAWFKDLRLTRDRVLSSSKTREGFLGVAEAIVAFTLSILKAQGAALHDFSMGIANDRVIVDIEVQVMSALQERMSKSLRQGLDVLAFVVAITMVPILRSPSGRGELTPAMPQASLERK